MIVRSLGTSLRRHIHDQAQPPGEEHIWDWIDTGRGQLAHAAKVRALPRRDFACTLLMVVWSEVSVVVAHVGDGAVVGRRTDGSWQTMSEPETGQYASTTYFITDDRSPRLRVKQFAPDFDALAVFSDGIEHLALDQRSSLPHPPFFDGIMKPLDRCPTPGKNTDLSRALAQFLDGPRVCDRTDDDKTLVLASSQ